MDTTSNLSRCAERRNALQLRMGNGVAIIPTAPGGRAAGEARIRGCRNRARARARAGVPAPAETREVRVALDEMRIFRADGERAVMRRAAAIWVTAHERAMRATRPGRSEYEIE